MPDAPSNGITLHYEVTGSGDPLLLIMGFRLSAAGWPPEFVAALAREFLVITFDNRGTGRSAKPTDGYAMANMRADALGLLDALGIDRPHVLGVSLGGVIAQELVLEHPHRVRKLILCSTACGRSHAVQGDLEALRLLLDVEGKTPAEAARQAWPASYTAEYLRDHRDRAEAQMQREIEYATPLYAVALQFQGAMGFDSYDRLPNIMVPTLVITGDQDILVPPGNSEILTARIPGARLHVLKGAAHRAIWEVPEEAARVVAEFLRE